MKNQTTQNLKLAMLAWALLFPVSALEAQQNKIAAMNGRAGVKGNVSIAASTIASDFSVRRPITVWQLGVFDDGGDGIQGSAVLTVQLYVRDHFNGGALLETITFDAANPGTLSGGNRFKSLTVPVTLLPGRYAIVVSGFDETNRFVDASGAAALTRGGGPPPWAMNDAGGLVDFEEVRYASVGKNPFPLGGVKGSARDFAAGTFVFSAANPPAPTSAADYAALTEGVTSFHFGYRRRTGSIALFSHNSFPVLVEPSGNRLVMEAAGSYNDDPAGGRAVAFSHPQWGVEEGDERIVLFENAIRWASRKSNPSDIVIGLGPLLRADHFAGRGYQVRTFGPQVASNSLPVCDVLVLDWHAGFDETTRAQLAAATARGVGLVVTVSPWELVHGSIQPAFYQVNDLLAPYGLAYRPSTMLVNDLGFTNLSAQPYPNYFSAYPAAELLGQDRLGQTRLSSLEKMIALNSINMAINARPDLLPELTSLSSGSTGGTPAAVGATGFSDVVVLKGNQATSNRLGRWDSAGDDLVSADRRGAVEYSFATGSADIYRLQIVGTQNEPHATLDTFELILSVDDVRLGHLRLKAGFGTNGLVDCFTPYLLAGPHTVRILWDNAASATALRIKTVSVQSGQGPDKDRNGVKDWVDQMVKTQSGLDDTNAMLNTFTSPVCLEGRDPYRQLMRINVQGSQNKPPPVLAASSDRWYADVTVPSDQNTPLLLNVSYQNGARSEWRSVQWKAINLLNPPKTSWTVRQGDSLLLTARPAGAPDGSVTITVGTNLHQTTAMNPLPHRFTQPGTYTVTGKYSGTVSQSGSITVKVVEHHFNSNPDAWVAIQRDWDLPAFPADVVLDADSHLIFERTAGLTNGGQRFSLICDQNDLRYVLSRLDTKGPILDAATVSGFQFWHGGSTYTKVVQTYADQSQLVEILLVLSPVLPDLTVTLDAIVGGVTFEDGSVSKTLHASDFNANGQCALRFLRPASARTSICHSIKVQQGDAIVGYVR